MIGHKWFGSLMFFLSIKSLREKLVHVDDTNHLVKRKYFLSKQYSMTTCEDMEFGRKIILSNNRFAYSNLISIDHHHQYNKPENYSKRVFLDNIAINKILLGSIKKIKKRHYIIDSIVIYGFYILSIFEETIRYFEEMKIEKATFIDIGTHSGNIELKSIETYFERKLFSIINNPLSHFEVEIHGDLANDLAMKTTK